MLRDAKVSVIDGQSLRMSRIYSFLDPIILTYKAHPLAKPQKLSFSLDHVLDEVKSAQKSGHYCMTVNQMDSQPARFLAIKEITVTQG